MAIGFARLEFVSRSAGKNACHKSAYNARERIHFEGGRFFPEKTYDFRWKEPPAYHATFIPSFADESFKDPHKLWNAAESKELRRDSQVAIELVVALPDDAAISLEDRIELIKTFVEANFTSKDLGVQVDIHAPDTKVEYSEQAQKEVKKDHNWHAHILVTTRRFKECGTDLSSKKARDLMPVVMKGRVVSGEDWGKSWGRHQNLFFEEKGLSIRVDKNGIVSQEHLGPYRMRGRAFALMTEQGIREQLNHFDSKDPGKILEALTLLESSFSRSDVDQFIDKHAPEEAVKSVREAFWKQGGVIQLIDKSSGEKLDRFTSLQVIEEEKRIYRIADRINKTPSIGISKNVDCNLIKKGLSQEQSKAFDGIISGTKISFIEGHAGAGKSYVLNSLKEAYEASGVKVRAFGPDSSSSEVLKEKGFRFTENIYRFLFACHNGKREIDKGNEVWMIDEAGKLGNRPLSEVLKLAKKNKVQLVFSGCSSQLPSVERGGMFKVLSEKHGAFELIDIQRQRTQEQRQIAQKLALGDIGHALDKLHRIGSIQWSHSKATAMEELVKSWAKDRVAFPGDSSIMVAYSNAEIKVLNELARSVRKELGEVSKEEFLCPTLKGQVYVSIGDSIEFRKNDRDLGVINGQVGTLEEASEDKFTVVIREKKGEGRRVSFDPNKYHSFQLGYARTHYRSQGETVDRAYVLHHPRVYREAFYVGLTRHVERVHLFIDSRNTKTLSDLKSQVSKTLDKNRSSNYITQEELDKIRASSIRSDKIHALKTSESLSARFKGYGLHAFDRVKQEIQGFRERRDDRILDQGFYSFKKEEEKSYGSVQRVEEEILSDGVLRKEEVVSSIPVYNSSERSKALEISKKVEVSKNPTHDPSIQSYFNQMDQVSSLKASVYSECESRSCEPKDAKQFSEWMEACVKRNELASLMRSKLSDVEIRKSIGEKGLEIVKDQSHRDSQYKERQNQKPLPINEMLSERGAEFAYRLFPEGPTSKSGSSLRFGRKGSLAICVSGHKSGTFYDFEKDEGGSFLDLIKKELGLNFKEAIDWARDFLGSPRSLETPPEAFKVSKSEDREHTWISINPGENEAPKLSKIKGSNLHHVFKEEARYDYKDKDGNLLFHVLRLRHKKDSGCKITPPLSYGFWKERQTSPEWALKAYSSIERPMYNLHKLTEDPHAKILIVEGEKAADAASKFLGDEFVCVTWMGGSGAVSKTDWSPLKGRSVFIWPDNDKAGFKAAESLCRELNNVGVSSVKQVREEDLSKKFPEKWDLADPIPEGKNVRSLILLGENKTTQIDISTHKALEKSYQLDR